MQSPSDPSLTFVGTGSAFDPDLPNTSLLLRAGPTLLMDCGYAVPHALWRISRDPDLLDAIWISHIHADHSFGLPGLLVWMKAQGRTRELRVIGGGGGGVGNWLERVLDLGYPGSLTKGRAGFPITAVSIGDRGLDWGGLRLSVAQSAHKVANHALRVDIEATGVSLAYSGDGIPTDATRALFHGVDLLVHECFWAQGDKSGHASAETLLPMADELDIRRLALLHLADAHKAGVRGLVDAYTRRRNYSPEVWLPVPGETIAL